YSSPDTHGQVLALGEILGTNLAAGNNLDENTVIVLPSSETLFPLLRQGLSAIPDYLKFVLHPYMKNIYYGGKSETTRVMFHTIEEELLKHKARTFTTIEEIESSENLFSEVLRKLPKDETRIREEHLREHLKAIHKSTIERFLSFKNIRDFANKCIDVLLFIFNNSTARLHP